MTWCVDEVLDQIKIIERTISLSWKGIPNIEINNLKELHTIQTYLDQNYDKNQLLY